MNTIMVCTFPCKASWFNSWENHLCWDNCSMLGLGCKLHASCNDLHILHCKGPGLFQLSLLQLKSGLDRDHGTS